MSVSLLIMTHQGIGDALYRIARDTFTASTTRVTVLDVPHGCETEKVLARAKNEIIALDQGDGVLVMTDLYGATPCNLARLLLHQTDLRIVTGINLSMLMRVLNYPQLDLDSLSAIAVQGGKAGIQLIDEPGND